MEGTVRYASCSWDHPGSNPFMGSVVDAVDRYTDIPADVRSRLKQKMAKRDYDDIASIGRDSINGKDVYDPDIRDMHFGTNRVCTTVSRSGWAKDREERGLVYCDGNECIIVPTVCRNVSRVTRHGGGTPIANSGVFAPGGLPPGDELAFDPPGAGPIDAPADPLALGIPLGGGIPSPSIGTLASALPWLAAPGFLGGGSGGSGPVFPANPGSGSTGAAPPSSTGGISVVTPPVPEPATWLLSILGLFAVAVVTRSRKDKPL